MSELYSELACQSTSLPKTKDADELQKWHAFRMKEQDGRLATAYFSPNYNNFDQFLSLLFWT